MMNKTLTLMLAGASMAAVNAQADTLRFTDGEEILLNGFSTGVVYNSTQDAELRQDAPNSNFDFGTGSSDPEFTIDNADPDPFRTQVVMRFDDVFGANAAQVPMGSTILSATLFIDIDNNGNDLELYRLTTGFGTETDVTWNTFGSDGVTPGTEADFVATIDGQGDKVTVDLTAIVADWAGGEANLGLAFLSTGFDGVDFDASENSDPADRPYLEIEYVAPVPVPAAVWLMGSALFGLVGLRRR